MEYWSVGYSLTVHGFSAASGRRGDQFDQKRNFSFTASRSRIKKRISNHAKVVIYRHEYGISNVEGRNSIEFYRFKRQSAAIPPFYILRFHILLFCGSLFGHAESHTRCRVSGVSSENARAGLKPETRNLKPMLGEGFTTPDNVPPKELFS